MSRSIANELQNLEEMAIRPDVVSYIPSLKNFIFVESKIVTIGLKEVGQLLGYCAIAQPEEALLVTTKKVSDSVLRALSVNSDILKYERNKKIKLGKLEGKTLTLI